MSNTSLQRWEYHDTDAAARTPAAAAPVPLSATSELTEEHVEARIRSALQEAQQRWGETSQAEDAKRRLQLQETLRDFAAERHKYFQDLESEVVHLALAVARKILVREASLDPDLLAGLVRISLDRLSAGAVVKLHVPPSEVSHWEHTRVFSDSPYVCEMVADASLAFGDCRVETDRGTASFGLEGQLKEIEQGLLDVLARRPEAPPLSPVAPASISPGGHG